MVSVYQIMDTLEARPPRASTPPSPGPFEAEFRLVIRGCLRFFNEANPHLEGNHLLGNTAATSP